MKIIRTLLLCASVAIAVPASSQTYSEKAISTDRSLEAEIISPESGPNRIYVTNKETGARRLLLIGKPHENHTLDLSGMYKPFFSLDGGFLYVSSTDGSPYRTAITQINVRTGATRHVATGNGAGLIRSGPYRGYLVVFKHRLGNNGPVFPVLIVRPDGHEEKQIPVGSGEDSSDLALKWIKRQGWAFW